MQDFSPLVDRIVAFRDARNWKKFHNPKDLAISLSLEAAELLEHFQWKDAEEMKKHLIDRGSEVSDELADVLYWVLLMAHDFNIDLVEALGRKMDLNEAKYPVEKAKDVHTKYSAL